MEDHTRDLMANIASKRLTMHKASLALQSSRLGNSIASVHSNAGGPATNLNDRVARIQNKINEI